MDDRQLKEFLTNFGIKPGCRPITLSRMQLIVKAAARWYGPFWARGIFDLFMPTGQVIDPGYEDSLSHYQFMPNDWSEMFEEW